MPRFVTDKDKPGKTIILSDRIAANVQTRQGSTTTSTLLRVTDSTFHTTGRAGAKSPASRHAPHPHHRLCHV